jgi:hypothetical protein
MENQKEDVGGISGVDPKKAGAFVALPLLAGLLGGGSISFVGTQDLFTHDDWEREKVALIQYGESAHAQIESRIIRDCDANIKREIASLQREAAHNRERLDRLIESTAKLSGLIEQHVVYQRENYQRKYRETQP